MQNQQLSATHSRASLANSGRGRFGAGAPPSPPSPPPPSPAARLLDGRAYG